MNVDDALTVAEQARMYERILHRAVRFWLPPLFVAGMLGSEPAPGDAYLLINSDPCALCRIPYAGQGDWRQFDAGHVCPACLARLRSGDATQ